MSDMLNSKQSSVDYISGPTSVEELRRLANLFNKSPLVTTKQLGEMLDISERRILQLVEEGAFIKKERNEFNLYESIHNYIQYLRRMKIRKALRLES